MTPIELYAYRRAMTRMESAEDWAARLGISPEELRRRFMAVDVVLFPGKEPDMPDESAFARGLNKMQVTGTCDAGCGKAATTWFGLTSCATCGGELCIARLQRDYDAMDGPRRAPDHPGVARRLRGTVPVIGTLTDTGRLLPMDTPPGHLIALYPNDIAEHIARQLTLIEDQAQAMVARDTLVAATLDLGEIRGRLLAMRDAGMLTDDGTEVLIDTIKLRYMGQWSGVFDTAVEPDK